MPNILIVDDDINVTDLLKNHLLDEGYEVTVAHRGEEGMAEALKKTPDVILLDVILPDATGFQMCSRFRQSAATQSVPIIMMTGVARYPNQQVYARERGANEYVLKPFEILEMGQLVDRYISSKGAPPGSLEKKPTREIASPADDLSELRSILHQALQKSKWEV